MTTEHSAKVSVQGDREILIEREFDAPKELVWEAFTKPEHVSRWWTAKRGEMTVCDIDFRVGGKWRYVMNAGGQEVGFHGEYREIEPHDRIVSTELYEFPGASEEDAAVNTLTLSEQAGRTKLTIHVLHRLPEHRDAHIQSGMEAGLQDALDLLEEIAQSLR